MSKISLAPDASGTGIFSIVSPNSNTNRTLTLPDDTGTIDRLNRAGNVLQVVSASHSTQTTSSSSTYADTGLSATITPTSTSSKILVFVHQTGLFKQGDTRIALRLLRDSTSLIVFEWGAGTTDSSATISPAGSGVTYLDSPSTTSAVTYKTQLASTANISNVRVNLDNNSNSTITLMEIAG